MAGTMTNGIRRVVRLRQMLRKWHDKARSASSSRTRPNVPPGHVAIYTAFSEGHSRRFVVRATYLNHPVFAKLLLEAEEEYGFGHDGPITIPCDESSFEDVIRAVSGSAHETSCGKGEEFRPLLQGSLQNPVW